MNVPENPYLRSEREPAKIMYWEIRDALIYIYLCFSIRFRRNRQINFEFHLSQLYLLSSNLKLTSSSRVFRFSDRKIVYAACTERHFLRPRYMPRLRLGLWSYRSPNKAFPYLTRNLLLPSWVKELTNCWGNWTRKLVQLNLAVGPTTVIHAIEKKSAT